MTAIQIENISSALDDVVNIEQIVKSVEQSMETLNSAIATNFSQNVEAAWAENFCQNWKSYYSSDIPATLQEIGTTANNISVAARNAREYSQKM